MATEQVNATEKSSGLRSLEDLKKSKASSALDKDAFLKLLVAQMSNQDPMSPSSNTEYIAQLAQFAMLEQMQQVNSSASSSRAYDLVGKYVYIVQSDGQEIFGRVDGTVKQNGIDYLLIGDGKYELSTVAGMLDDVSGSTEERILQSANLIGKTVTAKVTEEAEGEPKEGEGPEAPKTVTVTGQVSKITLKNGVLYATIDQAEGQREVPLVAIQEIKA